MLPNRQELHKPARIQNKNERKRTQLTGSIKSVDIDSDMIYMLTAVGLTPGGSSTVHIYTQTIHRTTQ